MRKRLAGLVLGLGLSAMATAPGWACGFHDQAADSQTQQQTAEAQPPSQTTTQ